MPLVVLVLLGLALRLTGLGVHSIWFDEAATLCVAEAADPIAVLLQDRHPPLSGLLFRTWLALAWVGTSDASLRLLPALASALSLILFARLAKAWLPMPRQAVAVALAAVSPLAIWLAHEVRMYAFVELASVIALLGVEAWRVGHVRRGSAAIAFGTMAATGFHYMGGLAAAAVLGVLLVDVIGKRASPSRALMPATMAVAGVLIWLPWLVYALPRQMATSWGWQHDHSLRALVELPARHVLVDASIATGPWQSVVVALAAILLLGFGVHVLHSARRRAIGDLSALAAWASPVLGALALWSVLPPDIGPRTLIAATAGGVACIGSGLCLLPGRVLRTGGVIAATFGCLALSYAHSLGNRREDYRSACAEVERAFAPGDKIVSVTGTNEVFAQHPLRHYLRHRQDLLVAIVDRRTVLAEADLWPTGTRIHVVYRVAEYALSELRELTARLPSIEVGPVRFRVQYLSLRKS